MVPVTRVSVTDNEVYPVYSICQADPEILAEHPDAGFEVSDEFITRYERARDEWDEVQDKIADLYEKKR